MQGVQPGLPGGGQPPVRVPFPAHRGQLPVDGVGGVVRGMWMSSMTCTDTWVPTMRRSTSRRTGVVLRKAQT